MNWLSRALVWLGLAAVPAETEDASAPPAAPLPPAERMPGTVVADLTARDGELVVTYHDRRGRMGTWRLHDGESFGFLLDLAPGEYLVVRPEEPARQDSGRGPA